MRIKSCKLPVQRPSPVCWCQRIHEQGAVGTLKHPAQSAGRARHPAANSQRGFTLLEVLVALTITGLALGGLFTVIAGNKQLAWRAEQALLQSTQVRSLINLSQLNDERGDVQVNFENPDDHELFSGIDLAMPERQTQGMRQALRGYEILDENGEVVVEGSYWVELDLPE